MQPIETVRCDSFTVKCLKFKQISGAYCEYMKVNYGVGDRKSDSHHPY